MKLRINRGICKAAIIILAFLLLGIAVVKGLSYWEEHYNNGAVDVENDRSADRVFINEKWYEPKKDLKTVLIIGLDKFADENEELDYINDKQADFLMLMIIDEHNKTCKTLQINRDTMAEIQILGVRGEKGGTFTGQLALSHTYGSGQDDSCRNVVDAVEKLLYGIKINHYVSFTMDSVAEMNDIVGGVTLPLLDDFTHVSPDYTKGAEVQLKGDMALTYVRGRHGVGDETNISRMERQKQYLAAFHEKLMKLDKDDEALFSDVIRTLSKYMVSDCTVNQFSRIYDEAADYFDGEILSIKGESQVGAEFMEFYPDEAALQLQVIDLFYRLVEE